MTSGQEMERVYSYNPRARTGHDILCDFLVCASALHSICSTSADLYQVWSGER